MPPSKDNISKILPPRPLSEREFQDGRMIGDLEGTDFDKAVLTRGRDAGLVTETPVHFRSRLDAEVLKAPQRYGRGRLGGRREVFRVEFRRGDDFQLDPELRRGVLEILPAEDIYR